MLQGRNDQIVPEASVAKLVEKLSAQRGIAIDYRVIEDTNHFFHHKMEELINHTNDYLDGALAAEKKAASGA